MAIKAILFDKDGTLIDVNRTWIPLYRRLLAEEFKVDAAGAEALLTKAGYDPATNVFLPGSILAGGTTRQLVELWWPGLSPAEHDKVTHRIDHDYAPMARDFLQPLMDLVPVFDALHGMGVRLGVGTNDSRISASGQMTALGVHHYFDYIIGADSVEIPKPSGHMIQHFAESTGFACSEIAMVGDNTHDMEEAHKGGAGLAIAVLSGNAGREHIAHLADAVLDSVQQLPDFLRKGGHVL